MPDSVKKVSYCYFKVPDRPGRGAKILAELKKAGVDMLAYSGFPGKRGKAQIDLVVDDVRTLRALAKQNGWRASAVKKGFLIQGRNRVGAVHGHINRLAEKKINVVAADALCAGGGRYGMILWVKNKDYAKASRALKAR